MMELNCIAKRPALPMFSIIGLSKPTATMTRAPCLMATLMGMGSDT